MPGAPAQAVAQRPAAGKDELEAVPVPGQIRRVGTDGAVEASPLVAVSDDSRPKGQAKASPDAPPAAKTKAREKSRAKAVGTP